MGDTFGIFGLWRAGRGGVKELSPHLARRPGRFRSENRAIEVCLMASKASITLAINLIAGTSYAAWHIGITNYPFTRRDEHGKTKDVSSWHAWTADSLTDAQDIESYFINIKGMKGGNGRIAVSRIFLGRLSGSHQQERHQRAT